MTVNERTKGYNGSLRAIQKSGGSRSVTRKARDPRLKYEIKLFGAKPAGRSVIIIRLNSASLISFSHRKIPDHNRIRVLSFPVYIRARPYFDSLFSPIISTIRTNPCNFITRAILETTREYPMPDTPSASPFEFRPLVTSTKQRWRDATPPYNVSFPRCFPMKMYELGKVGGGNKNPPP